MKYFGIPEEEALRGVFSCYLGQGTSTIMGRLFISNEHVMFHGKKGPFSLVGENRIWPFSNILDVDKDAKYIRVVMMNHKKYHIGSLSDQFDRCFNVLQRTLFGVVGNSALHVAVDERDYKRVHQILDLDVTKLNVFNHVQLAPLHIAFYKNDVEMVKLLLNYYASNRQKVDINAGCSKTRNSFLHVACTIPTISDDILMILINFPMVRVDALNADDNTPLHYFCEHNHSLSCKKLGSMMISRAENIPSYLAKYNRNKETAMHKAVFNKKLRIFMVQMLVKHHRSILDMRNEQLETPLHYAVRLGREDLVHVLLASGADPSLRTSSGLTPKEMAQQMVSESRGVDSSRAIAHLLVQVETMRELLSQAGMLDYASKFASAGWYDPKLLASINDTELLKVVGDLRTGLKSQFWKIHSTWLAKYKEWLGSISEIDDIPDSTIDNDPIILEQIDTIPTDSTIDNNPISSEQSILDPNPINSIRNPKDHSRTKPINHHHHHHIGQNTSIKSKVKIKYKSDHPTIQSTSIIPSTSLIHHDSFREMDQSHDPCLVRAQLGLSEGSWEIDSTDLEYTQKLGFGASGKVFKGLYRGQEVALKVLTVIDTDELIEEFKKEFLILTTVQSPNMVTFYGASIEPTLTMVMEYCSRGSLYHVLTNKRMELLWPQSFGFCIEMALGMATLHAWVPSPIVHRDLKSLNLLVTHDWHLKVCDFGLSRMLGGKNLETFKKLCGTFAYCAPEIFDGGSFTPRSDVYSMGVVLWEITYRTLSKAYLAPFAEYTHINYDFQIIIQAAQGLRPTIHPACPKSFSNLITQCLAAKVEDRPTSSDVHHQLVKINQEYIAHMEEWDKLLA